MLQNSAEGGGGGGGGGWRDNRIASSQRAANETHGLVIKMVPHETQTASTHSPPLSAAACCAQPPHPVLGDTPSLLPGGRRVKGVIQLMGAKGARQVALGGIAASMAWVCNLPFSGKAPMGRGSPWSDKQSCIAAKPSQNPATRSAEAANTAA